MTFGNGYIRAVVSKSNGVCSDLRLEGGNNLLLNGGRLYMDSNSGGDYFSFSGSYALVEQTSERVHFKITGQMGAFEVEWHYVLQVGDSGFHTYAVYRHGSGDAATYLEQARMVMRVDKNVFTQAYTSAEKTGQMIAPELLSGAPEIMDATLQLPASSSYTTPTGTTWDGFPVYTKYDWADYLEDHTIHGVSGDEVGLWMITGSQEFMNGGPTKGELFVHGTNSTPLMLGTFHAQHFVGSETQVQVAADAEWEKLYGPFFIYLNAGESADAVWDDARERAEAEVAAWPLEWMDEPTYPTARGSVTGALRLGGELVEDALLVLGQPGSDWQVQGEDYLFWTRSASDGSFTVPAVRPGNYSLYVMAPGASGELEIEDVTVEAGGVTDLGRLTWTPPARAQRLWQLGVPDRSTAEFRFGDAMRQFGLWWRYLEEQGTADLDFTIGESTSDDWYFAQMVADADGGVRHSPRWNVHFDLDRVPSGPCELVFDFAGSMSGTLNVSLNNTSLDSLSLENDAGIYRSVTRSARYTQQRLVFDPARLQAGMNTLSLQLSGGGSWSGERRSSPSGGVMYDAIRLEAGAPVAAVLAQDYPLSVVAGIGGTVSGGGYFASGDSAEIEAMASAGYRFLEWSDGSTEASRTVTVEETVTYTAIFEALPNETFAVWAATNLPEGDRSFAGDANGDGIPNGFEYAYGPLATDAVLLEIRLIDGVPTAVSVLEPNTNGAIHTELSVIATDDLDDWSTGAVALDTAIVLDERHWTPTETVMPLFFRALLSLKP